MNAKMWVAMFITWIFIFPMIRDIFYLEAATFKEPLNSLLIIIGSLFDPTVDIMLFAVAVVLYVVNKYF